MAKNKIKIINDAVHGFITIPSGLLYELIQHRFFQRLSRIKQLGVSSMVYPSATHTRFQHSLGAMHLTVDAIKELRLKGNEITPEEEEAVLAAILFHDLGHCPYSHALEQQIVNVGHEELTEIMMRRISAEMGGALDLAISIFRGDYHKKFLHQLISSQLDMDRFDYLMRDSFFTGVVEGAIGSARIIKMLDVADDKLVVERKGILSVENYLITRQFMYWQVYFHKTSVAGEAMLKNIISRAKHLCRSGVELFGTPSLIHFLKKDINRENFLSSEDNLMHFVLLDDSDLLSAMKVWAKSPDRVLATLSEGFINRKLFKTLLIEGDLSHEELKKMAEAEALEIGSKLALSREESLYLTGYTSIRNATYSSHKENICVRRSDGTLQDISEHSSFLMKENIEHSARKNYIAYYKI